MPITFICTYYQSGKPNTYFSALNITMGVRRGVKTGIFPPLEIETKHQDFLENMKLGAQYRSIDLIFAVPLSRRRRSDPPFYGVWVFLTFLPPDLYIYLIIIFFCIFSYFWCASVFFPVWILQHVFDQCLIFALYFPCFRFMLSSFS